MLTWFSTSEHTPGEALPLNQLDMTVWKCYPWAQDLVQVDRKIQINATPGPIKIKPGSLVEWYPPFNFPRLVPLKTDHNTPCKMGSFLMQSPIRPRRMTLVLTLPRF
ncbi:hypothetical protein V2G26_013958 [Clonostachys chloroleuca]